MTEIPFDIARARISVIGAARSGMGAVRLMHRYGVPVYLSEGAAEESHAAAALELQALGVLSEFGGHSERVFDATILVVSPGVPSESWVVVEALRRGIPVISELELASYFCQAPMIAITGTNGKTTTTALSGAIFRSAGMPTLIAGNIGTALSDAVIDTPEAIDVAVLEVSSFQLDHTLYFHPRTAIITTITPDHLGRYQGSFDAYVASKQRVFRNQTPADALIYSFDDPDSAGAVMTAQSSLFPVSAYRMLTRGGWIEDNVLCINAVGETERIAKVEELSIRGRHNCMNVLMASLAARLQGVPTETITEAVRSFQGVEHRLEFVRRLDEVSYINDSKATNVDSVVIALQSFQQPVVLIAGGRDKEAPYDPLFPLLDERVRAAVLLGEAADRMSAAFAAHCPVHRASTMEEAVATARSLAVAGDAVLLSPACASFDMFDNFEHRGNIFKQLVQQLPGNPRQI